MNKKERGIITVESSMVLMLITLFILFLFSFGRVYRAQNLVSHAVLQSVDAVALESYLRETAFENDVNDVVKLASHITTSSAISAESLESLRTANVPKIAKEKFAAAIASTKEGADAKLRSLGVKDGIDGIDFSECTIDLTSDDVIVAIRYVIEMQYPVFGANEITVTKAAKAKTFGEILFAVTTKPNVPGWGTTSGDDKVTHGSTVQIKAEANYGYVFVGWDDGCTDATREVVVEDAQNYVAIFEKDKFGINLSTDVKYDGAYAAITHNNYGSTSGAGTYSYLDMATIKAIPTQHYQFVGWDDNNDGQVDNTSSPRTITVDKTYNIKAVFKPKTYTVKVKVNNNGYGSATVNLGNKSGASVSAEYGSKVQLVAVSKNNTKYKFEKWSNNSTQSSTNVTVQGDKEYTASFYLNVYTVTFKNGSTTLHSTKVIRGSSIDGSKDVVAASMASNPTKNGASFSRWICNGSTFTSSTRVNSNITVTPMWKYTVKLDANGGKINNSSSVSKTVEHGASFNFDAYSPTRSGYSFEGWYSGNNKISGNVSITSGITVKASWKCKHTSGFTSVKRHEFYCKAVHNAETPKCRSCGYDCRPSGVKNSYEVKKCKACSKQFTVENEKWNWHYGISGYGYVAERIDACKSSGADDFNGVCDCSTHYVNSYSHCSTSSGYNAPHNWGTWRHILCNYCHKVEQPSRTTGYYGAKKSLCNKYGYSDCDNCTATRNGAMFAHWCGTHVASWRPRYTCPF